MQITEALTKKITETSYLTAINADRYRVMLRYFYEEYEKIHYWLNKEEVFAMMQSTGLFPDYTINQCQLDLQALLDWGNLTATQDSAKAATYQEFKNKKFRYQLSEYTVEIERLTLRLENLEIEGASLQPSLIERIRRQILNLPALLEKKDEEAAEAWTALNNDFIRLNRNYQDYIRTLNSAHAEEMMKTEQFLVFKDQLLMYLRTFVKALQEHALVLEEYMRDLPEATMAAVFKKIARYELSIPRIEKKQTEEQIIENCQGRWHSLKLWFVGENGESEISRLYDSTNEIIRRMTRYAQQISERYMQGASRADDYRHLAQVFLKCQTLNEAHTLSAMVFGPEKMLHLKDLPKRSTDSIDSGVYDEAPAYFDLDSRSRKMRQKSSRLPQPDYRLEREMQRLAVEEQQRRRRASLRTLIHQRKIDFAALPVITPQLRKILLNWLSRGLNDASHRGRTEEGIYFHIDVTEAGQLCVVRCEDGNFIMPHFILEMESDY
jgi:uncharacterized protein (TIGR02677 family)